MPAAGGMVTTRGAGERQSVDMASMTHSHDAPNADDPYHLSRFVRAQEPEYAQALSEIKSGQKRSHWMWYIFPQVDGLAFSSTSKHYAITSVAEAQAYLDHPVLGPRLLACAEAVLGVEGRSATEIFIVLSSDGRSTTEVDT